MVDSKLTYKYILKFWAPLSATWLMMSLEGPFLAALIARMPEPKFNLAAYGVAYAIALIIEAPVIMVMSASTALVKSFRSYIKLRNFTYAMNVAVTLIMLTLLIEPIYNYVSFTLLGLNQKVADLTYWSIILLLPWPAAIGYRRFFQGILIKYNKTKMVGVGTVIRLISMASTGFIMFGFFEFDGVYIGAAALSVGVVAEAIFSKVMVIPILRKIKAIEKAENELLEYKDIFKFYYPLAMTSILGLGVHPMVTFLMGQSRMALESLAVLPVVNSLVFIFRSLGLSFQEVLIALAGEKGEGLPKLTKVSLFAGSSAVIALGIIAFTPLSEFWFSVVSGLSDELTVFAIPPVMILTLLPGLTFLISYQRSLLVHTRKTKPITIATSIEVVIIISVMVIGIKYFDLTGIIAASFGYLIGRIGANIYLTKPMLEGLKHTYLTN